MKKSDFINRLRDTAAVIKPLTISATPGSAVWNGTEYIDNSQSKQPDPYALSWWSILGTIADLIEKQESPLSTKQIAYLEQVLFGGMGSLSDLYFDQKSVGKSAEIVNKELDAKRHALFLSFKSG